MGAVDQGEKTGLLTIEKRLDDDRGAGGAEAAGEHRRADRRLRLFDAVRDRHPLAGGEPVGLDDDRRALGGDIGLGRRRIAKAAISRGRDGVPGAEILGEALRSLERGGRLARPEGGDAGRLQPVDQPGNQRLLGTDDDEIDAFRFAKSDQQVEIRCRNLDALGLLGDPGIARRAIELVAERRGADRPAQRMFAPPRADDQNPHAQRLLLQTSPLTCLLPPLAGDGSSGAPLPLTGGRSKGIVAATRRLLYHSPAWLKSPS